MRVEVYYNLHKSCWSVRALEGENKGRVIMHTPSLVVDNAKFIVQPAGRQRVIAEKQKNVHAFVRGNLNGKAKADNRLLFSVTYNPYENESFVNRETKEPVFSASRVNLHSDRKVTYLT